MAKADTSVKRKPALTIEQQIDHLKEKGVKFEHCSEEQAADYLAHRCIFSSSSPHTVNSSQSTKAESRMGATLRWTSPSSAFSPHSTSSSAPRCYQ